MNRGTFFSLLLIISLHTSPLLAQTAYVHHGLSVTLSPAEHRLSVIDSVTVPADRPREMPFTLHKGLAPASPTPGVRIEKRG